MKCDDCYIRFKVKESKEPAVCCWYMENVVLGNKSVDECKKYRKNKKVKETEETNE